MTLGRMRAALGLVASLAMSGCGAGGIDTSLVTPISNSDAYATIGYLWGGVRSAILNKREPSTNAFSLPLTYQLPCTPGGQGSFQGTLGPAWGEVDPAVGSADRRRNDGPGTSIHGLSGRRT